MADDRAHRMFLLLDGIPGGSTVKGRKGWIDISGVDWGVHQSVAFNGAGGMAGLDPKQRQMQFTARSGVASPLLFEACVTGKHITKGTFEVQRGKSVAVRWVFEDILVMTFASAATAADHRLIDTFALLAGRVRYSTKATRGWDFLTNQPW